MRTFVIALSLLAGIVTTASRKTETTADFFEMRSTRGPVLCPCPNRESTPGMTGLPGLRARHQPHAVRNAGSLQIAV